MSNGRLKRDNCQLPTVNTQLKKGYKQTEVGVIPSDWEVDKIKNLTSITTGTKNTQDKIDDGEYPFFVRSQIVERINNYSFDGEAVLTAGDGVGTGKVFHYINGRFDFHQRVYNISDFNERLDGYFFYLFFSNNFLNRIMQMTAKSSVDSVRMEMIANMQIPIPPLPEQNAIATVLSDADALISSLEKLIAKKRNIKQGAMRQLLTGKKRLPGFSGKWEVKKLGDIFIFLNTANNSREDLIESGDVGYVHYGDIHTKWSNFLDCSKNYIPYIKKGNVKDIPFLENGDLVVADASEDYEGIGVCVEIKNIGERNVVAGLHTLLLRGNKSIVADGFKGYLREIEGVKDALIRIATGISVYGISKNNLKNVKAKIPPIKEQIAIAQVLSDMDAEIETLEKKLEKYKMIKQGMMQILLTGKIRLV